MMRYRKCANKLNGTQSIIIAYGRNKSLQRLSNENAPVSSIWFSTDRSRLLCPHRLPAGDWHHSPVSWTENFTDCAMTGAGSVECPSAGITGVVDASEARANNCLLPAVKLASPHLGTILFMSARAVPSQRVCLTCST